MDEAEKTNAEWIGLDHMEQQLIEECGELIKAVCKVRRASGKGQPTPMSLEEAEDNMWQEVADVIICLESLIYLSGVDYQYIERLINKAVTKVYMRRIGVDI